MLEMLKSKVIIGFIVFALGTTFINSVITKNFESNINNNEVAMVTEK